MHATTVVIFILVFGLVTADASGANAQRASGSDMSTGDGGPIQPDQYGPPLRLYLSPPSTGKGSASDKRMGDNGVAGSDSPYIGYRSISRSHRQRRSRTLTDAR